MQISEAGLQGWPEFAELPASDHWRVFAGSPISYGDY